MTPATATARSATFSERGATLSRFGLLSLLSGIGFVAGGWALLARASWGPGAIAAAAIASMPSSSPGGARLRAPRP